MKHVCVAARIGDGKAPGAANIQHIRKTSNAASADSGRNPLGLARVLAHGIVASHLLRMTKLHVLLRALSQNRDSASRVSCCYGLLIAMERCLVTRENLIACAVVEENVFLNSIALQNKGYACMQVD